jgi:hypothetical protein
MPDINKFSFSQMCSNSDGKTSGSGTVGIIASFAGILGFLFGVAYYAHAKDATIMNQSIIVLTIGAGLLGYRKSHDGTLASTIVANANPPAADPPADVTSTNPVEEQPADPSLKS